MMRIPSHEYRRTAIAKPRTLPRGLDRVSDAFVGRYRCHGLANGLLEESQMIDAEHRWEGAGDEALGAALAEIRPLFRRGGLVRTPDTERRAMAVLREVAARQTGMRPYPVQLAAGLALHRGNLVEMATGEGKTLAAALAGVLHGWSGKPCHVVTVNDYLAERDATNMRGLYEFCGLKVGFVTSEMNRDARATAYACDVVYTTSKELVADFLRDRLKMGQLQDAARRMVRIAGRGVPRINGLVQRGLHAAIVDEADSVLIDEAVTPLIIAKPCVHKGLSEASVLASELAGTMIEGQHYRVDARYKEIELLAAGQAAIDEQREAFPTVHRGLARASFVVRQALQARHFFTDRQQYVTDDDRIVIVDEFTGRAMPDRTWSQGLHQAVEAKEGLEVSGGTETLARLSYQRFFRFFTHLSGTTGTAAEAQGELWHTYRLPVLSLPQHRPCRRIDHPDRVFADQDSKWQAVVDEIIRTHAIGRPVLVGTRNVAASELLAGRLAQQGIEFCVLNAVNHREEAQIIARAGTRGTVTIATNMAGRGTDIVLADGVAELGGLHVIATERHESRRVDRQLFGRGGRQGDPGSAQAFVAIDDDLIARFFPASVRPIMSALPSGRVFALAQATAQRLARRRRVSVLAKDSWTAESLSFAGGADARLD